MKRFFTGFRKIFSLSIFALLVLPVGLASSNTKNLTSDIVKIYFKEPFFSQQVADLASSPQFEIIQIEHNFNVQDQPFTGFYQPEKRAEDFIQKDLLDNYRAFLQDGLQAAKQIDISSLPLILKEATQKRIKDFEGTLKQSESPDLKIQSVIAKVNEKALSALKNNPLISKIEVKPRTLKTQKTPKVSPKTHWENWSPEQGWSYVYPSLYGGRYTWQFMWWDDTGGFNSNSTYEHDFFLNNYDGRTYFDSRQTWDGFPLVIYAVSSLPAAYLDTRSGDPRGELAYTIGSARASDIRANIPYWYDNYIRMVNGNTNSDSGKLWGQRGYRNPSWCYSVWCSFGSNWDPIVSAWNIPVPGTRSWQN